jgi:hypothetical protein
LTEEERKIALARANRDSSADTGYHVNKSKLFAALLLSCAHVFVGHIVDAFKDWRVSSIGECCSPRTHGRILRSTSAALFISEQTLRLHLFLPSYLPS